MSKIRHALIMAAGRGLRMMPLTASLPKAMAPIDGTTLIAQGIAKIATQVEEVHVTVGHHAAMLAGHVIEHGARTVLNTEGQGNAWWVYNTFLRLLDEPLLVLTCDNVVDLDVASLAQDYDRCGRPACMLVPVLPVEGIDGDYIEQDETGVVSRLSRSHRTDMYCSGVQVINPQMIIALTRPVEDFTDLWSQLIPRRHVRASRQSPTGWLSIDTLLQLQTAQRRADRG